MPDQPVGENISAARLDGFRVLVIGRPERFEFLQGQLTQDVELLDTAGTALSGWASAKGRLLAVGQLIDAGDEIWWPLPADIVDTVARRLTMFVLRADVTIVVAAMPIAGLLEVGKLEQLNIAGETTRLESRPWRHADGSLTVRVVGDPNRAWLIGPAADMINADPAGSASWELESIRSGLPLIVADTQDTFVPQMVNLDRIGAISFDKGCYVGQEIVARTQNLGRIKRRMYRFAVDNTANLPPGSTLYGPDKSTGKVVLSSDPGAPGELLAVVPIDAASGAWHGDEARSFELRQKSLPYEIDSKSTA